MAVFAPQTDPLWPAEHAKGMRAIQEAVAQFEAGFAAVRSLTPEQEQPSVDVAPLECTPHMVVTQRCATAEEAAQQFASLLRFPYPSLQSQFDLYWRRQPDLRKEEGFEEPEVRYVASARYVVAVHKEAQ